jgi:hypothetical protein
MRIARVFPTKTNATPRDELSFFGPPGLFLPPIDEVHISTTFTWDIKKAEFLARQWEMIAPVKIGGPACGSFGGDFVPGRYVGNGYVITSRGCPRRCWHCSVWKRDGDIRELPITDGWILQDDDILAASDGHIRRVFEMLKRNKKGHRVELRGIEPAFLKPWHVELMRDLKPHQIWTAYDTPDDLEPLIQASKMLISAGFSRHTLRCYVLIGFNGDTFDKAIKRMIEVLNLGMFPFAMLYRDKKGATKKDWARFQRTWCRPASIYLAMKKLCSPRLT